VGQRRQGRDVGWRGVGRVAWVGGGGGAGSDGSDNKALFLHKRNVRQYNHRKNYDKTCRWFIYNSPDHLSKTYPNKDKKCTLANMKNKKES
jgi:hypothetical protein